MAIQKNFVIKNGLEVNGALVSADSLVNKVGIGTNNFDPLSKLTVDGSIKAENLYLKTGSGIGSIYNAKGTILQYENAYINTGIVTNISGTAVTYTRGNIANLTGTAVTYTTIKASTNLYVSGALFDNNNLDGDLNQVLTSTGAGVTWKSFASSPWSLNGSDLYYSSGNVGVGTNTPNGAANPSNTTIFNAGIVTANYYYGDGSGLTNLNISAIETDPIVGAVNGIVKADGAGNISAAISGIDYLTPTQKGIGIRTEGGNVGFGITYLDLRGAGVSTTYYTSGITTIYFEGGGSGTIGFGTEFPETPTAGDLFYNAEYGRTFVYYDETIVGSGTSQFWVDASPFNGDSVNNNAFIPGSTVSPSWYIEGDSATGVYSPSLGNLTFLSNGTEILNTNPSGIEVVTGIATFSRIEAIQTGGSSIVPLYISADTDANTPALKIEQSGNGAAIFIDDAGGGDTTPFIITEEGNVGIGTTVPNTKLDVRGTVEATSFIKSGGTSSQFLKANGSIDSSTYLTDVVQDTTPQLGGNLDLNSKNITGTGGISITGIITATTFVGNLTGTATTAQGLTGNPSISVTNINASGIITATDFNSTSDITLKENITTVDNALELTNQLRGVRFEWKKDGKPSYGVIAQELEVILPELVSQGDPKTVNYNGLIGVLIEAVKELSAEVEQLKNK